jgi:transposase
VLERLKRHDLADEEWERLRAFLPARPRQGGRWADHRAVINGILIRMHWQVGWFSHSVGHAQDHHQLAPR